MSTSPVSQIPAPGELIGAFRVVREIGRGGRAAVLEVVDARSGERRAIKLLLPTGKVDEAITRFRQEHRALSRLQHPGVLRVYEGGTWQEQPYFVMDLLEGRELREEVELWRELPPADRIRRAEEVLVQVARALEYIHVRGLVHRDVTPANIWILPDGAARLMDFGVVKEPGGEVTNVGEVVGTVAYMSPEQIAGGRVDARADLYSLGAVLYLMLTGRRPFNARTVAGYLEKHLNRPARPPSELVPMLPDRLNEVCVRLLAKDPSDRFSSATHLLHVLEADAPAEPLPDPRPGAWRPGLVGRAAELAEVQGAVARLSQGQGGVLLILGASGMGKTRLAEEAVAHARRLGLRSHVARNTSADQEAYAGFRSLYDELRQEASPSLTLEAAFGRVSVERATPGSSATERVAIGAAFRELLPVGAPMLIFLDDVDRADRGTLELLTSLVRMLVGLAAAPVLFVLAASGLPDDGPLRQLAEGEVTEVVPRRLYLGPLPLAAVEALLLGLVVDDPRVRQLAVRLHREGEGNPAYLAEMLHGLMVQGILQPGEDGARGGLAPDAGLDRSVLPVPRSLAEALRARLTALSPIAQQIARVLAVARSDCGVDLIIAATNLEEEQVFAALDELAGSGLVRERRQGGVERYELAQNRVTDVALEGTPEAQRSVYHRRLGEALERLHRRQIPAVVELLAWHFEQGDAPSKAFPYQILAAEKLLGRGFVSEAMAYLDRGLVSEHFAREYLILEDADRRVARLLLLRATALFHLGRWTEAQEEALRADAIAHELGDAALLAGTATELGTQARRRNDLVEAERQLRRGLEEAQRSGVRALATPLLYELGGILWTRGDLEGARGHWLEVLAASRAEEDDRSLAIGYSGLGVLAFCRGQTVEAREHLEKAAELCERHGLVERLVVCTTNLVELCHLTGHFRRGLALAERALQRSREMNHRFGISVSLFYRALVLTDLGRWSEAEELVERALAVHRDLGTQVEDEVSMVLLLARLAMERHEIDTSLQRLDRCLALVEHLDVEGFAPLIHAWRACALAEVGRADDAREALRLAQTAPGRAWPYQRARLLLSVSRAARLLGDRPLAGRAAEEALAIAERCGYRYYVLLGQVFSGRAMDADVAVARFRSARSLAVSLAGGLDRADGQRFLEILQVQMPVDAALLHDEVLAP